MITREPELQARLQGAPAQEARGGLNPNRNRNRNPNPNPSRCYHGRDGAARGEPQEGQPELLVDVPYYEPVSSK